MGTSGWQYLTFHQISHQVSPAFHNPRGFRVGYAYPTSRGSTKGLSEARGVPKYPLWSPLLLFVLNPAAELSGRPVRLDHGYLEGDALDDAPVDPASPPIVELGGGRVGVTDQVLDLLDGDVLGQQSGDDHDAEGMRRQVVGETG